MANSATHSTKVFPIFPNWHTRQLILASQSPRRKQLIELLDLPFIVRPVDCDETWPAELEGPAIPRHVSELKARACLASMEAEIDPERDVVLTSDTVVQLDGATLEKPTDNEDARRMLRLLSGRTHKVTTAFTLAHKREIKTYHDTVAVTFMPLPEALIARYVESGAPLDKAGSYGAQDLIGAAGIEKLEGSFYTVMGLPMHMVFDKLQRI